MKIYHRLKKGGGNFFVPERCLFFDTETKYVQNDKFVEHDFWFGYMIYIDGRYRDERIISQKDDFWIYIDRLFESDKTPVYCIAHNAFFDFMIVGGFEYVLKYGYHLRKPPITDKGLFIMEIERGNDRVVFLNLGNWFKTSVKELGKTVGIEKFEMPSMSDSFDKWVQYCKRDVEVIEKVFFEFMNFIKMHDLGGLSYTIASQAFNTFLYRFLNTDLYIHANKDVIALERRAYHGGRTEAFYLGQINDAVYVLDVHSMYPSVMRDMLYPVKMIRYYDKSDMSTYIYYRNRDKLIIADVLVETDKPIVPYRHGRLIAPVGKFWTALTSVEIDFLLENGGKIHEWGAMAVYNADRLFSSYVDYFYTLKENSSKQSNKTHYMLYKLFLNSLYGKFGQRTPKWQYAGNYENFHDVDFTTFYDPQTGKRENVRIYAGVIEKSGEAGESFNSFVAIAAFVTAYAWVKLTRYIITAGWGHVYYCDTDSIFCDEEGYQNLLNAGYVGDELGKLGLEYVVNKMIIYGLKDYEVVVDNKTKVKLKGISKDAVMVIPDGAIMSIAGKDVNKFIERCMEHGIVIKQIDGTYVLKNGSISLKENELKIPTFQELSHGLDVYLTEWDINGFAQLQWLSFAGHVRCKRFDKYVNRIVVKKLKREYKKGILTETGWVKPFELNEEQRADEKVNMPEENAKKVREFMQKLRNYANLLTRGKISKDDLPSWAIALIDEYIIGKKMIVVKKLHQFISGDIENGI